MDGGLLTPVTMESAAKDTNLHANFMTEIRHIVQRLIKQPIVSVSFQHILSELRRIRHLVNRSIAFSQRKYCIDNRFDAMFVDKCKHVGEILW